MELTWPIVVCIFKRENSQLEFLSTRCCQGPSKRQEELGVFSWPRQRKEEKFRKLLKEMQVRPASSEWRDIENHLNTTRSSLHALFEQFVEREKEIVSKANLCNVIDLSIKEKERELDHIKMCISEGVKRSDILEKSIQLKSEENRRMMEDFERVTELKEIQLTAMQASFDNCRKKFELQEEQIGVRRSCIDQLDIEIQQKEEKLNLIRSAIMECSNELDSKEKELDFVQKLKEKIVDDRLKEIELKEKKSASLERLAEERLCELETKRSQFETRVREFELRQEEFEFQRLEGTYIPSVNHHTCLAKEQKELIGLLNQQLKKHNLICNEIFLVLQASSDPAKLALRAMQENYHSEYDSSFVRSCTLLSELLMKASPISDPQVREDAMKFANAWKAKMRVANENYLEVFAFLQLLASYRLASSFSKNVLQSLLQVVGLAVSAPELCRPTISAAANEPEFLSNKILHGVPIAENSQVDQLKKRKYSGFVLRDQPQRVKIKPPQSTRQDKAVGSSSCEPLHLSKRPFLPCNGWTKPPRGYVKLNFGFWNQEECGFSSVVARDDKGMVLAIWHQKTPESDPLMGKTLAAHGALTQAISSEFRNVYLEGDSLEVIRCLQGHNVSKTSISSVVSDSRSLLKSFSHAVIQYVPPDANVFARVVAEWAAKNSDQDGEAWIPMPSSLVSIFENRNKILSCDHSVITR